MCKTSLRALEKHFNEKYGVKLNITTDRDYEYKVENNHANDLYNKVEMICTKIGTGKEFNSVELRLIVTNLKMVLEKKIHLQLNLEILAISFLEVWILEKIIVLYDQVLHLLFYHTIKLLYR